VATWMVHVRWSHRQLAEEGCTCHCWSLMRARLPPHHEDAFVAETMVLQRQKWRFRQRPLLWTLKLFWAPASMQMRATRLLQWLNLLVQLQPTSCLVRQADAPLLPRKL